LHGAATCTRTGALGGISKLRGGVRAGKSRRPVGSESQKSSLAPSDTVLVISVSQSGARFKSKPNLPATPLADKVLASLWNKSGNSNQASYATELIGQIHYISQYLGRRSGYYGREGSSAPTSTPVLLAEVRSLDSDYLRNHLADTFTNQHFKPLHVLDPSALLAPAMSAE